MVEKDGSVTVRIDRDNTQEEIIDIIKYALNELGVKIEFFGHDDNNTFWRFSKMKEL